MSPRPLHSAMVSMAITVLLCVGAFAAPPGPAGAAGHAAANRKLLFVHNGSLRLCVEVGGEGSPPVILVHGLAGDLTMWNAQLRHLWKSRRAAALDLRGHGRSGRPSRRRLLHPGHGLRRAGRRRRPRDEAFCAGRPLPGRVGHPGVRAGGARTGGRPALRGPGRRRDASAQGPARCHAGAHEGADLPLLHARMVRRQPDGGQRLHAPKGLRGSGPHAARGGGGLLRRSGPLRSAAGPARLPGPHAHGDPAGQRSPIELPEPRPRPAGGQASRPELTGS